MLFFYYKIANHITPCGMVRCSALLLGSAVRLYHFVGGFSTVFAVCAIFVVWRTPLSVAVKLCIYAQLLQ